MLIDASNLGTTVKEGKNQKTLLSHYDEEQIITTFNGKETVDGFSVVVSYEKITAKDYSLSAGQYFDVKIEYSDISQKQFSEKLSGFTDSLESLFSQSHKLESEIKSHLSGLKYDL